MPRRRPIVLAFDIGTSSVRSALFDDEAHLLRNSRASQNYRVCHSRDHGAELDPAVLLRAAQRCLRQTSFCLTKSDAPVVAGSGFWHSLLGLDRTGKPLTPIYTWADARCAEDAIRLRAQLDERTIQQRTGCMLRTSFWPAKLAWLRRTQPRCFGCVARWVSPAEWIFEKCFGTRACSHSMASGTGLYDLDQHDWDEELLAISCLTRTQLGPLSDRDEIEGAAIFPALGDGAASNLGSGATRPGFIAINVGTSAAVRTIPPNDAPLPFGLFKFVVDRDRDLLGGAISNAGNLRAWSLRELRLPNDNPAVERLLRKGMKNPAPLTLLPFLVGERAPSWPENLSGTFVGLTQATTATDLLVAAIQSATFRLADILLTLEGAVGRAKTIIVSGGILQSRASLQILADSLGRDLTICADQEASLRGAAVHALEQLGRKPAAPKFAQRVRHDRARSAKAREDRARQNSLEALLARWD